MREKVGDRETLSLHRETRGVSLIIREWHASCRYDATLSFELTRRIVVCQRIQQDKALEDTEYLLLCGILTIYMVEKRMVYVS
jgi:hypothetical protein